MDRLEVILKETSNRKAPGIDNIGNTEAVDPKLKIKLIAQASTLSFAGVCGGKPDVIPYKTESVVYIRPRLSRRQYRQLEPKVCGRVTGVASHVYYGEGAQRGDYPWMALIKIPTIIDGSQVIQGCGGTVISRYFVLTAAHCTQDHPVYGKIIVSVGDVDTESGNRLQTYRVPYDHVTAHPGYRPDDQTVKNDLALIRMDKPFNFSGRRNPECHKSTTHSSNVTGAENSYRRYQLNSTDLCCRPRPAHLSAQQQAQPDGRQSGRRRLGNIGELIRRKFQDAEGSRQSHQREVQALLLQYRQAPDLRRGATRGVPHVHGGQWGSSHVSKSHGRPLLYRRDCVVRRGRVLPERDTARRIHQGQLLRGLDPLRRQQETRLTVIIIAMVQRTFQAIDSQSFHFVSRKLRVAHLFLQKLKEVVE
ncbi:hypothetical protein ANN_15662 [Periplaneta americana]|uniref:Peptidase S1 domain-containing protein n=1 Tax=Periplaneta americana TaxID=6978 RepID=A0ABQ8SHE0_PERAM|nr:hypothetical protein ANN_15662 [Periplaneta americana]